MPAAPHSLRPLFVALGSLVVLFALAGVRLVPPHARGLEVATSQFSADRAFGDLEFLLGDSSPHPVGSAANLAVRQRLDRHLTRLGYQTETQTAFTCSPGGVCAQVQNLLARRPGAETGPFGVLMTHYDSVGAGPGAGDDGLGTAALMEAARALAAEPPGRNRLLLLVTDGEEAGLLGAQAFLEGHPLARQVAAVVNLEARGTSGSSLLFETSGPGNAWLLRQAAVLPRPLASSVFATIYDLLPNDTDLSVFKRRGVPGVNFAVIGEPRRYHTPRDDLAHLDRRSLQHHGDHLLALARRLSQADLGQLSPARVAFFDLLGFVVVRWPLPWQPWLLALSLAALAFVGWRHRREATPGRLLLGAVAVLLALLVAAAVAFALTLWWRHARPGPRVWVASGWAPFLAAGSSGLLGPVVGALLFPSRLSATARWMACWLIWALLALAATCWLPGAAYLFLAPSLVAAVAGLLSSRIAPRLGPLAVLLPVCLAALLAFPLAWLLGDAMGLPLTPATSTLLALVIAPLAPLVPPGTPARRLLLAPLLGLAIGGVATAWLPPDSVDRPQRLALLYLEDGSQGRLLAVPESGRLPESMRAVHSFGTQKEAALPWSRSARAFATRVGSPFLPAPELTVLGDEANETRRHLRLRLTSRRGASAAALAFRGELPGLEAATVIHPGHPPVPVTTRLRKASPVLLLATLPAEGIEIDLVMASKPLELIVADRSPGLPPLGQALFEARPPTAVAAQDGDVTVVWRQHRLPPGP